MSNHIENYLEILNGLDGLNGLLAISDGLVINANDTFNYACADAVIVHVKDLEWVLPIYKKYGGCGLDACLSIIVGADVIKPLRSKNYMKAKEELKKLNPEILSEY